MKKTKRFLAVFLCAVLALALCPALALAADGDFTAGLSASSESTAKGGTLTVDVTVSSATQTSYDYAQVAVNYDSAKLSFVSAVESAGLEVSCAAAGQVLISSYGQSRAISGGTSTLTTLTFAASNTGEASLSIAAGPLAGKGESVSQSAALAGAPISVTITQGTAGAVDVSWYDAGATEFIIVTPAQLAGLSKLVGDGVSFSGKTVKLGGNIDLTGYSWTPIGSTVITKTSAGASIAGSKPFAGIFDGNGKTISGLSVSETENGGAALFGYSTGTLKDFTLSGTVEGNYFTAGVAALASGAISGVTNLASVTAAGNCVGGILGDAAGSITITDCHNKGTLTSGGAVSEKSTGRMGGIAGRIDSGITAAITNCSNTGSVTVYQYGGGIIGGCFGSVSVSGCFNSGSITGLSFGKVYIGGIAGKLESGTVDSCYNTGAIHDAHLSAGHIRAVGGIVGCEEDHAAGTAVSNCYNTGVITLNTGNMTEGTNYIYMSGNISGGSSTTGANAMVYEDCFYLTGTFPAQAESHASYKFWSDVYKADRTAYDTSYVTAKTAPELKAAAVLTALGAKFIENSEGGFPLLYWQTGAQAPALQSYAVSSAVTGGSATVNAPASAAETSVVSFTITGIQSGRQIKSVAVTDASGAEVTLGESGGTYSFVMPARAAAISVTLENTVDGGAASHALSLPAGLDAIWSVTADSTYMTAGSVKAGATVAVHAAKADGADTTVLNGITVTGASGTVSVTTVSAGEYTFTMPDEDAAVALDISYSAFTVKSSINGVATTVKSYSRSDMEALAAGNARAYYSGWSTETTPFIGAAESYVTLSSLLSDAGLSLTAGSSLTVTGADGFSITYTYENLLGAARWYYSDILANKAAATAKTAFAPMFVIKGNTTSDSTADLSALACDTLNTYRFVFGQTESELANAVKIVDSLPKCVVSMTVNTAGGGGGGGGAQTGTGNINAAVWDGKSIDVSWYSASASEYYISTPAQLAGLAAIVNGIYNSDIDTFAGNTACIVDNRGTNSNSGGDSGNNLSTANFHYGSEDFSGKTVYLTNDIDMSGGNYMPVGGQYLMTKNDSSTKISASFNGTFDGQGHSVTIQCDRHCSTGNYGDGSAVGLIGRLGCHDGDDASQRAANPTVKNVAVCGFVYANRSVGGVVGKIGKTKANDSGLAADGAVIESCANFATVKSTDSKGVGGIAGAGWNGGFIRNCYNAGSVISTYASCPAGGISGSNEVTLENCYNIGSITSGASRYSMAIGTNNNGAPMSFVKNCWYLAGSAAGGGYYSAGAADTSGAMTSADMKTVKFVNTLGGAFAADTKNINNGYPVLAWQNPGAAPGTGGEASAPAGITVTATDIPVSTSTGGDGLITASAAPTQSAVSKAVADAVAAADKAGTRAGVELNAAGGELAFETVFTLPSQSVRDMADNEKVVQLTIATAGGSLTLDESALGSLSSQASGGSIVINIKTAAENEAKAAIAAAKGLSEDDVELAGSVVAEVSVTSGGRQLTSFSGTLTVSIPVDAKLFAEGESCRVTVIHSDGSVETLSGRCVMVKGALAAQVTVKKLSTFIVSGAAAMSYSDVAAGSWYYTSVAYVTEKGLMSGVGGGRFDPDGTLTRAMMVTMLYRLAGSPAVTAGSAFSDVAEGAWYADAIAWADANGVVEGYGNGAFGPADSITREQMAAVFYRYCKLMGYDTTAGGMALREYADYAEISDWALEALGWANAAGLMTGRTASEIAPGGTATRAEAATILMRFCESAAK